MVRDGQTRIVCACGYSGNGEFRTTVKFNGEATLPHWEVQQRQHACINCKYFSKESCHHPDIKLDRGCRQSYIRRLHSVSIDGCAAGNWKQPHATFIRTAELIAKAEELCSMLPSDIGRVIGIPRSGLLPATAIATRLHLPLFTVSGGQVVPAGGGSRVLWGDYSPPGRTLIVDDTIHNGGTMEKFRSEVPELRNQLFAAIYTKYLDKCDFFAEVLPTPHLLEWNLFNGPYLSLLATDFDGIICHNPPHEELPLHLPRNHPVRAIITARPERFRDVTIAWCQQWGVRYEQLIMWPGRDEERDLQVVAEWKASEFMRTRAEFYIESEPPLAEAIRRHGVRVLCPKEGHLR